MSSPASSCGRRRGEPHFAASHGGQTFTQFYGTNGGKGRGAGANAFGKCVSTIAKHKDKSHSKGRSKSHGEEESGESHGDDRAKSQGEDSASPAMTCKAMQAHDLAHFQATYGARPNAFGQCVAGHANGKKG